jgi:hypothetical protein
MPEKARGSLEGVFGAVFLGGIFFVVAQIGDLRVMILTDIAVMLGLVILGQCFPLVELALVVRVEHLARDAGLPAVFDSLFGLLIEELFLFLFLAELDSPFELYELGVLRERHLGREFRVFGHGFS